MSACRGKADIETRKETAPVSNLETGIASWGRPIDGRVVWDLWKIDIAFTALPDGNEGAEDIWGKCAV